MSLTADQEAALRANTTAGDPFDVHSASVAAWRNVWALLDSARASLETEREMRQALEVSQANLVAIARGGDASLPVAGVCVEVRDRLVECRAKLAQTELSARDRGHDLTATRADLAASQAENVRLLQALAAWRAVEMAEGTDISDYDRTALNATAHDLTTRCLAACKPGAFDALLEWSSMVAIDTVSELERNDWLKPDAMHAITEREVVPVIVGRLLPEGGQP